MVLYGSFWLKERKEIQELRVPSATEMPQSHCSRVPCQRLMELKILIIMKILIDILKFPFWSDSRKL